MNAEGAHQGVAVSALRASCAQSRSPGAMRFASSQHEQISGLEAELGRARAVTSALMAGMLALAETRRSPLGSRDRADRIRHLIRAEAWTDAALAILELGLPQWKLRCITYEDSEWFCSLGKRLPLPTWLDDVGQPSGAAVGHLDRFCRGVRCHALFERSGTHGAAGSTHCP
jgi:hypothetical protein